MSALSVEVSAAGGFGGMDKACAVVCAHLLGC
jgi:hypothetical protein